MNWTGGQRNNSLGIRACNKVDDPMRQRIRRLKRLRLEIAALQCRKGAVNPVNEHQHFQISSTRFSLSDQVQAHKHLQITNKQHV